MFLRLTAGCSAYQSGCDAQFVPNTGGRPMEQAAQKREQSANFVARTIAIDCFERLQQATPATQSEIIQVERGPMRGQLRHLAIEGLALGLGRFDRGLISQGVFSQRDITFGMLFECEGEFAGPALTDGHVGVWSPGAEHVHRYSGGAAFGGICVSAQELERFFGSGSELGCLEAWKRQSSFRIEGGHAASMARVLHDIVSRVDGSIQLDLHEIDFWKDTILDAITGALARPDYHSRALSRRLLYDILDFLEFHEAHPMSVARILAEFGLSRRSLHRLFHEEIGIGPIEFLRDRRLCRARSQLKLLKGRGTIADVAFRSGFCDVGRFCAYYRRLFAEYPAETVKRHRLH
ncbi:AraC family transcriptional regulator [Bosea sp. CCNWLW174]